MMRLVFEWDRRKDRSNIRKHGISFETAKSIFGDERLLTFADDFHSNTEERLISIGMSQDLSILLVVHTEIESAPDEVLIRLISARRATGNERKRYEEG